jgi:hypothetical protein
MDDVRRHEILFQQIRHSEGIFCRFGTIAADVILHWAISALSTMSNMQLRQTHCPPKRGKIILAIP